MGGFELCCRDHFVQLPLLGDAMRQMVMSLPLRFTIHAFIWLSLAAVRVLGLCALCLLHLWPELDLCAFNHRKDCSMEYRFTFHSFPRHRVHSPNTRQQLTVAAPPERLSRARAHCERAPHRCERRTRRRRAVAAADLRRRVG